MTEQSEIISERLSMFEETKESNPIVNLTSTNPSAYFSGGLYSYNPVAGGERTIRKLISKAYKKRKIPSKSKNIFLTTGTSESISYLIKLFCNLKDEILIPAPGYPLFEYLLDLENIKYSYYHYYENLSNNNICWKLDLESIKECVTEKTKMLILVNPNNPLGTKLEKEEFQKLEIILKKKNIILVIDEVFREYALSKSPGFDYLPNLNLIILDGVSKSYALPGFKISWMLFLGDKQFLESVRPKIELICDTYLSVSTPSQLLLKKFLIKSNIRQRKIKKLLKKNINLLKSKLSEVQILSVVQIDYGWFLPIKIHSGFSEELLLSKLEREHGVRVYPGKLFHFLHDKYFVVSLLTETKVLKKGIKKILEFFSQFEIEEESI